MDKFIKFCIERRKITIAISIFILLYGAYAYYYMPRQEMPNTSNPAVQVTTIYAGASAKTVEEQVTKKIEDEIAKLDGVHYLSSASQDNICVVFGVLEYNVDYDEQWEKLRSGLEELKKQLPEGIGSISINTNLTLTNDLILVFHSEKYDDSRLKSIAQQFKSKLSNLAGIKQIDLYGEKRNRVSIELNYVKLNHMDISILDVFKLLQAQNVVIPAGDINTQTGKINVVIPKALERLEDFKNIIVNVSKDTGLLTRLSDIAKVEFTQKSDDKYFLKEGSAAIMLGAKFDDNQNIVLLGEDVKRLVSELKAQYPEDLNIDQMIFKPDDVKSSVNEFIVSLLQGVLFVVIVIFVGMGYRNAIVVSLCVPLSIAITFIYMGYTQIPLHQVSISALIIALGMLVDNSIVISDAVQEHINHGMEMKQASFLGAKEQMIPIFTSTLTTIAAFSPLISLPGEAGEFVSSLPIIIIVALISSFVVAMLVIPAISSISLKEYKPVHGVIERFSKVYTRIFEHNIKHYVLLSISILLAVSISIYSFVKYVDVKMFPYVDKDLVYINISNDVSGNIDATQELVLKAEELLKTQPEILDSYVSVGGDLPRFYMTQDFMFPGESNAQLMAKFDLSKTGRYADREEFRFALQKLFDNHFKNAYASVQMLEIKIPGHNIEIRSYSDDQEKLAEVSSQIYEYLQSQNTTMNVQIIKPNYKYQYKIDIDDAYALRSGFTRQEIQAQLNMALNGINVGVLNNGGDNYDIFLNANVKDIDDLKNFALKSSITQNKSALRNMAKISLEPELDAIRRYDRHNMILVSADVIPKVGTASVQAQVEEFIASLDIDGVEFNYGGDADTTSKYLTGLIRASILAVILIYLILLVQFNSFIRPFIVMATVLLAMIGIVISLILTRTNFTFTVGLGAASLMGVVVNNGILLIEYIDRARANGMDVLSACRTSVGRRMRPILLSSITTVFGLFPLVLANSSFFTPMAIALMGGLLVATFTTITVVPVIYYMVYRG